MDKYVRIKSKQTKKIFCFGCETQTGTAEKMMQKASYTIEAAVYVPMMLFLVLITLKGGISFYKESKNREVYEELVRMDAVSEFYTYQMIQAVGEEKMDD